MLLVSGVPELLEATPLRVVIHTAFHIQVETTLLIRLRFFDNDDVLAITTSN